MLRMDLRCFDIWMMQKRRRPFGERTGQLQNCPAFHGQLKVSGDESKQTKFIDEFLIYPPYEIIHSMTTEEQNIFFQKEIAALQSYFPDIIILSATVHRDEVFEPKDEEIKALFPTGKVTPHMHLVAIPIVYDKKNDIKKISISLLWKGKDSYRKFQDYMYQAVGKEYFFDRGEIHDFSTSKKHLSVEEFKLQEKKKALDKKEEIISIKEDELCSRAKEIEPRKNITLLNIKKVVYDQRGINITLENAQNEILLLQQENKVLMQTIEENDNLIQQQTLELKETKQKLNETENILDREKSLTNDLLNISIEHEKLRELELIKAKQKIIKFERIQRILKEFLPLLKRSCPSFFQELMHHDILGDDDVNGSNKPHSRNGR